MSAPTITPADVARLVAALAEGAWMTAAQLAATLYGSPTEANKRRVRAIASAAAPGVVSYPGSPGYKAFDACTVPELQACVDAYGSQTDEMRRRRDLYRRALFRRHPATPATFAPDPSIRPTREQLSFL